MGERAGYLRSYYGAHNTWAMGSILTLRAGESLAGVTVRMVAQSVISGKAVLPEGASTAFVRLYQQRYGNGRREWVGATGITSDVGGEFRLNKLAPGRYRLAAQVSLGQSGSGLGRDIETFLPGVADAESAEIIELRRGQTISDLRLPLLRSQTFTVSGTLAGLPSSSRVLLYLRSAGLGGPNTEAIGDQFKFTSVPSGSYVLVAADGNANPVRLMAMQPVRVSGGDIEGLTLDLSPTGGLRGTVKFAGVAPDGARLRVRLTPVDGILLYDIQAEVTADGTFTIPGAYLGTYFFDVQGLPAGAYIKSAIYGKKDALGGFDLARTGGDEKLEIVVGVNGARISGVVRDEQGKVLDAVVTLIPDPPQPQVASLYQLAQADETGRFLFQGVPPGKYRLCAWEELEEGAQFDPDVTAPFQARSTALDLAEGERKELEVARIPAVDMDAAREPR
jgi:hypothetical protein